MGATLVLDTSVERRESSNLSLVTGEWLVLDNSVYRKYKLGYRIVAIAADCKLALFEFGGSSPSTPTNELPT
jgi:hypothetical protein